VTGLTFNDLRDANLARLPLFNNAKGEQAHSEKDGSDWLLSAWSNAAVGELGEMADALLDVLLITKLTSLFGGAANLIKKVERGDKLLEEARSHLADEFADVQTYLDILAFRSGVDLGEATRRKWNAVSARVNVPLRLETDGNGVKLVHLQ
jgi:NTP pyrophosphatase (non-canonical NTP hydrolase)